MAREWCGGCGHAVKTHANEKNGCQFCPCRAVRDVVEGERPMPVKR